MRRAVGGTVPSMTITYQGFFARDAFLSDQPLEGRKPVSIVGLAGVRVSGSLRAFDFVPECRRPLSPGEQTALLERDRHGEGLRFPRLAEYRSLLVTWKTGHRRGYLSRESGVEL